MVSFPRESFLFVFLMPIAFRKILLETVCAIWTGVDEHPSYQDINIEEVINTFAQRQTRRLLFA